MQVKQKIIATNQLSYIVYCEFCRNDQHLCWYDIFNGTETRWIIDDGVIPPGKEYTFRVAAENANGLGPFSFNSTRFTFIGMRISPFILFDQFNGINSMDKISQCPYSHSNKKLKVRIYGV